MLCEVTCSDLIYQIVGPLFSALQKKISTSLLPSTPGLPNLSILPLLVSFYFPKKIKESETKVTVVLMVILKPDIVFLEIVQYSAISRWIGGEVIEIKE